MRSGAPRGGGRAQGEDRGAAALVTAICAVVLMGVAAFAVDMGVVYFSKRELSVAVDGAALSGAQAAGLEFPVGQGCDAAEVAMQATAQDAAAETYMAAAPRHSQWGDSEVIVECVDSDADGTGDTVDVVVSATATWSTFFAGIFGVDQASPGATAGARVDGSPAYGGLRPFALCEDAVAAAVGDTSTTFVASFTQNQPGTGEPCSPAVPGNWGVVDFDGGSNPTGDLADWTREGYPDPVVLPAPALPGDPGANYGSSQVRGALGSIVGRTVLFPVADSWVTAGGNNASFDAVGAVAAKVCGYQISPAKKTVGDCWDPALAAQAVADTGADMIIQWQYRDYVTEYGGGDPAPACDLSADTACVPTVRLYR